MHHSLREEKSMEAAGFPKLQRAKAWNITPKTEDLARLQKLLNVDPLERHLYTESDKLALMICRNHYTSLSSALQIFLQAIDWSDPEQVCPALFLFII
jgi:phosphatidylinositol-4,5-bisphosphate 3-kinase